MVGDLVLPTHSNGDRPIEMSAVGVTKASTLAELCERHGIPASEVAAFGDMPNDLPMLTWAGRSYAVANAHPAVLAAVDHKVPANDEDGVARTLEELFSDRRPAPGPPSPWSADMFPGRRRLPSGRAVPALPGRFRAGEAPAVWAPGPGRRRGGVGR